LGEDWKYNSRENYRSSSMTRGVCACMGRIGTDPFCPCEMKQKGLDTSHHQMTPEQLKELQKFIDAISVKDKTNLEAHENHSLA
jgi:hypothetical protein